MITDYEEYQSKLFAPKIQVRIFSKWGVSPVYATVNSAGADLMAYLRDDDEDFPEDCKDLPNITLQPGEFLAVPTGVFIELPPWLEADVRARSGLAAKFGIGVLNGPGTIDADYRGELRVILINHSKTPFVINHGDRIAQLVVLPFVRAAWSPVEKPEDLTETKRGTGGFGSTGV